MVLIFNVGVVNMIIVASVNRGKALDNNKNTTILFFDIRIMNFIVRPIVNY